MNDVPVTPYDELFEKAFAVSENLGFPTYDYLPQEEVEYPFVFIGEQFNDDQLTKGRMVGESNIIVHVFHDHLHRRELNDAIARLRVALLNLRKTEHFSWFPARSNSNVVGDGTEANPTFHGFLDITYKFN